MLQILVLPLSATSISSRWTKKKPPSAKCADGKSTPAGPTLAADSTWTSDTNTVFDGTYRYLLRAAKGRDKRVTRPNADLAVSG